ncbi:unnamed protein product, partial [Rangifer tarandus platyrhynchus]
HKSTLGGECNKGATANTYMYEVSIITVGVLGGDGQSAAVVNVGRGTLSGWSLTTLRLVSQITERYKLSKWPRLSKSISLSALLSGGTSRHQGNDALA